MAQGCIVDEIKLAIFKRHIRDRAKNIELLHGFRGLAMDMDIVFNTPSINATLTHGCHGFTVGGACNQKTIFLLRLPDHAEHIVHVGRIKERLPSLRVGAQLTVIFEISLVDVVFRHFSVFGCGLKLAHVAQLGQL